MGADQQFCLRWNNFHTNITSAFESLRDDEDFVDITLASEGKQIKAHKMVLSACSPYFRSLLKGNPCQHPIVFLKDVTFANLTSILDFMYHGEVNVSHNELATFLKTAEALKVRGLAEDEKKKESEGYNEASSPPPPRDPPDPGSPRPGEEANSAPDTHTSDSPPPKRQRRRSGASIQSADDTNETVLSEARESSVKNEPQDFNEDEADMLIHSDNQDLIKHDTEENNSEERNFGLSESVTISRSQAAMQQLQESFGSFLPGMGQSPGFLPHGATDMPRPPPYSMEGVQGLPPGISALPGPSMSQGAASQDASQGDGGSSGEEANVCRFCWKVCSNRYNLKKHERDLHFNRGAKFNCDQCNRQYSSLNSLQVHRSNAHPTGVQRRRIHSLMQQSDLHMSAPQSPLKDHHISSQPHQTQDLQRNLKSETVPYRIHSLPLKVFDVEDFESNTEPAHRESATNDSARPVGLTQEMRNTISQRGSLPINDRESGDNHGRGSISRGIVGNSTGVSFSPGSLGSFSGSPTSINSPSVPVNTERGVGTSVVNSSGEQHSSPVTCNRLYSTGEEQNRNKAEVVDLSEGSMSNLGLGMWSSQGGSVSRELVNSSSRNSVFGSISTIHHVGSNNTNDPVRVSSPAQSGSLDHGSKMSSNSTLYSGQSPSTDTSNDLPFYMRSLST